MKPTQQQVCAAMAEFTRLAQEAGARVTVRIAWPMQRINPKSDALLGLLAEAEPGICGLCDEPIPPGRRRKWCGSRECKRLYHALYSQDRRVRNRSES